MTTLIQAMLETAKAVMDVYEGTATSGSTTTLVDTKMVDIPGEYLNGGTLWFSTSCVRINTHSENTLRFDAVTSGPTAATAYSAAPATFTKQAIKQAVLRALVENDTLQVNSVMTPASTVTLASGVSNVRRVTLDGYSNYQWKEMNGKLYFNAEPLASAAMEVWYLAPHSSIDDSGTVNVAVDLNWLKWAGAENLWRGYMQKTHRDNPVSMDMLNEAKQEAEKARMMARRYALKLEHDPKHITL